MPGASSVVASNFVYSVAKPDGLTVGIPNSSLYLTQLVGRTEVKFDVRKFEWIGTQEKWTQMLYFRADAPFKTIGDVIKAKEPPKCGASGFASSGYILPKVLEETVGAKFNVIVGYSGGKEIDLAVEKGEVVCRGHDISSHFGREPFNTWHAKRYDRHLVQDARTRDPQAARDADDLGDHERIQDPAGEPQRRRNGSHGKRFRPGDDRAAGHAR